MRTKIVKKKQFNLFPSMKVRARVFFCAALLLCGRAMAAEVISTVVIDPGHGGDDPGAVFGKRLEKDIVLDIAKRFGTMIGERHPGVEVIYTRSTDVRVALDARGRIANDAGADLFISIHINSNEGVAGSGTETYVMGTTKGADNLRVAMRENDVIRFEEDPLSKYQGYVPGSPESMIMFSLMQYSHREQSMALARDIQRQYASTVRLPDRGVKEAGLLVLWRTAMPAILTEMGFINNDRDAKLLDSPTGRESYARCLLEAFTAYKTRVEGGGDRIVREGLEPAPEEIAAPPSGEQRPARQNAGDVIFAIQVLSSPRHIPSGDPRFGVYRGKVSELKVGNAYKYYVEECDSYERAQQAQRTVRKAVKDAFMIALRDGQPIPVSQARELVKD
jgi:N-acetylmuramoyl-L-alanine amidase